MYRRHWSEPPAPASRQPRRGCQPRRPAWHARSKPSATRSRRGTPGSPRRKPTVNPAPPLRTIAARRARRGTPGPRALHRAEQAEHERAARDAARANATPLVANLTDPDSRLMPTRGGFVQAYNAQRCCALTG